MTHLSDPHSMEVGVHTSIILSGSYPYLILKINVWVMSMIKMDSAQIHLGILYSNTNKM